MKTPSIGRNDPCPRGAYIAQIETGKREGRIDAYRAIASVLDVNIDDLV